MEIKLNDQDIEIIMQSAIKGITDNPKDRDYWMGVAWGKFSAVIYNMEINHDYYHFKEKWEKAISESHIEAWKQENPSPI